MSNESKESPAVDPSLLVEVGNTKIPMSELIMALDLLKGVSGRSPVPRPHRPSAKDAVRMWNQFVQDLVEPQSGEQACDTDAKAAQIELAASVVRADQVTQELTELKEKFATLSQLHTDERANSEALATALGVARAAAETQRVELSTLQEQLDSSASLAAEKDAAIVELAEAEKAYENVGQELGRVIAERDGLAHSLAEVAARAEQQRADAEQLRASLQASQTQVEALATAAAQAEAVHAEACAGLVAAHAAALAASDEAHSIALASQLEAHAAEVASLKAENAEVSAGGVQLARTLAAALVEQQAATNRAEQLQSQLALQASTQHECTTALHALESRHAELQGVHEAMQARVLELEAQLAEGEPQVAEAHVAEPCVNCASLEGQVDSLQIAVQRAADIHASLVQHAAKLHADKRQLADAIGGEDPLETLRVERANAANVVAYAASLHAELCYESSLPTQSPPPVSPSAEQPVEELAPSYAEASSSERMPLASTRPNPRSEAPALN
jgi:chromosome segregation ATPase